MEQLFISLCRGNLGLFMEIQTLLNNRCSSEKENFFCFGEREGWRRLFLRQFGKELNVCSGIERNFIEIKQTFLGVCISCSS